MIDYIKKYYKNKTVLVTGHTGFKGSWISIWLNEMGAKVIGYSLDPYTPEDNFILSGLNDKIVDIRSDIRNFESFSKVFEKYSPQVVFHLAAQPLVRLSYDIPRETYEQNIMGTVNALELFRNCPSSEVFVGITSDKCYENREWVWGYRENDRLGGYDPYSSSKAGAEIVISAYRDSFFNPLHSSGHNKSVSSVRAGNVIGGGDWAKDRIVPDCIRALKDNKPINIRNPYATRPWQHVIEPLYGYLLLAAKMSEDKIKYSGAWNFGPDSDSIIPVKDIAEKIVGLWGNGQWKNSSDQNKALLHEANVLSLDCSKSKKQLNWKPLFNIDQALELTVNWYKNYAKTDVYDICKEQINKYCCLLG